MPTFRNEKVDGNCACVNMNTTYKTAYHGGSCINFCGQIPSKEYARFRLYKCNFGIQTHTFQFKEILQQEQIDSKLLHVLHLDNGIRVFLMDDSETSLEVLDSVLHYSSAEYMVIKAESVSQKSKQGWIEKVYNLSLIKNQTVQEINVICYNSKEQLLNFDLNVGGIALVDAAVAVKDCVVSDLKLEPCWNDKSIANGEPIVDVNVTWSCDDDTNVAYYRIYEKKQYLGRAYAKQFRVCDWSAQEKVEFVVEAINNNGKCIGKTQAVLQVNA